MPDLDSRGGWLFGRVFVETCPACAQASNAGFCGVCADEIARVAAPCRACGLATPVARCPRREARWHVDEVIAPFAYAPPLDGYVHALKYRGVRNLGRALALLLARRLERDLAARGVDLLVPVPLHRARLRERGYNQAVEIARVLGHAFALPLLLARVERRGPALRQTGRAAAERWSNTAGSFAVHGSVAGLRVAIVDDVITTGATVNALAAELRAAGAASCVAWAVARTPEARD